MVANFNKKQKGSFARRNLYFAAGGILLVIASAALIFADIKVFREKKRLNAQIEDYKKQIEAIRQKNAELRQGIAEAGNNDYIEKVAREEFDLQKPGEKVVAFVMPELLPQKNTKQDIFNIKTWAGWIGQAWSKMFK